MQSYIYIYIYIHTHTRYKNSSVIVEMNCVIFSIFSWSISLCFHVTFSWIVFSEMVEVRKSMKDCDTTNMRYDDSIYRTEVQGDMLFYLSLFNGVYSTMLLIYCYPKTFWESYFQGAIEGNAYYLQILQFFLTLTSLILSVGVYFSYETYPFTTVSALFSDIAHQQKHCSDDTHHRAIENCGNAEEKTWVKIISIFDVLFAIAVVLLGDPKIFVRTDEKYLQLTTTRENVD